MTPTTARAADLDAAHVAWSQLPWGTRPTFGAFAVNYRQERGLGLPTAPTPAPPTAADLGLPDSPLVEQALAMGVEEVADLLAALAERDLHWTPGEHGQCGVLAEGQSEPPDLYVVFDAFRGAWQRDDASVVLPGRRWFGPNGAVRTWAALQRVSGPMTPEGGIAPTAPAGADGCEGGTR